jgi:hypothetical protein
LKRGIIILLVFSPFLIKAQNEALKSGIDSMVTSIENQKGKTKNIRWLSGVYEFKVINSSIVRITHASKQGPKTVVKEFFRSDKKGLMFSTESEKWYYGGDSIIWIGRYYFQKGKMIDMITIGHGKSETDDKWEPEKEVLVAYYKALDVYTKHKFKKGD